MPLPIDVSKVAVWGGRPNSVCGLSCHISHHGTESMWLKKISHEIKETWMKKVKELQSIIQNSHAPAHWCWQGGGVWGGRPNSMCGLSCHLSHHGTESMLLKKLPDVVKETWAKKAKEITSNLQNKLPTAHWCWQGSGVGQDAKLSLWAKFLPFPVGNVAI